MRTSPGARGTSDRNDPMGPILSKDRYSMEILCIAAVLTLMFGIPPAYGAAQESLIRPDMPCANDTRQCSLDLCPCTVLDRAALSRTWVPFSLPTFNCSPPGGGHT